MRISDWSSDVCSSDLIARLTRGAVNDEVELVLSGGDVLTATVTHTSSETLGLRKGAEAIALIKASAIIMAVDDGVPLKLSARNQLHGPISALPAGALNSEVDRKSIVKGKSG